MNVSALDHTGVMKASTIVDFVTEAVRVEYQERSVEE